jgi:peptidylprolyl isomerase
LVAACGYSDPTPDRDPVAIETNGVTTSQPGADDFNAGAGKTPVRLPDGLQYIDLVTGSGDVAQRGEKLTVQYTGWLSNGKKFDSSRDRNQPFDFTVGQRQVIPGWDEGLPGMRVGGKRKLVIPPDLAYGAQGQPPTIPANSTLVFVVELLGVGPGQSPTPGPSP